MPRLLLLSWTFKNIMHNENENKNKPTNEQTKPLLQLYSDSANHAAYTNHSVKLCLPYSYLDIICPLRLFSTRALNVVSVEHSFKLASP